MEINQETEKLIFLEDMERQRRTLGFQDKIRLDSLREKTPACTLVHLATLPNSEAPQKELARDVIQKMYSAVFE